MISGIKALLVGGLIVAAPSFAMAHGGKGAMEKFTARDGTYPASAGHSAVVNNPTDADNRAHQATPDSADPPGLDPDD